MKRILWVVLSLLVSVSAHSASFDCAKAVTKVEKIICGDAELSKLDEELNAAYKAALQDVKHADVIKQSQKQWMKERDRYADAASVKWAYETRLSLLKLPIITTATGKLIARRIQHTATLLPNGKVLITGGVGDNIPNSAELYDPGTNNFIATGGLAITPRFTHTATLLPNGKVLVTGGYSSSEDSRDILVSDSAELYDPVTGLFSVTGSLTTARYWHTATLLANGKVLIEGITLKEMFDSFAPSTELYDLATGKFSPTGSLATKRHMHTATLLPNGTVLITGGEGPRGSQLASAELYDPITGIFTATGSLSTARVSHTATLLPNGKVLVVGGLSAELYDPTTGAFSSTGSLSIGRIGHTATLLPNGKVLIVGGASGGVHLSSIELYDPSTGTFSTAGRLIVARPYHTATLLPNGKVLIVGGNHKVQIGGGDDIAELYDPDTSNK